MNDPIDIMLSNLERDYYDGVRFQKLSASIEAVSTAVLALDMQDPLRQLFEDHAVELWDGDGRTPMTLQAVRDALSGDTGADHLRAWANFYKVVALRRNVA